MLNLTNDRAVAIDFWNRAKGCNWLNSSESRPLCFSSVDFFSTLKVSGGGSVLKPEIYACYC